MMRLLRILIAYTMASVAATVSLVLLLRLSSLFLITHHTKPNNFADALTGLFSSDGVGIAVVIGITTFVVAAPLWAIVVAWAEFRRISTPLYFCIAGMLVGAIWVWIMSGVGNNEPHLTLLLWYLILTCSGMSAGAVYWMLMRNAPSFKRPIAA